MIKRALDAGVWMINAGADKKASVDGVELANKYKEGVYATVGLHPTESEKWNYDFFKNLAQDKKVVAIGECGLDYFRLPKDEAEVTEIKSIQKTIFELILKKYCFRPF